MTKVCRLPSWISAFEVDKHTFSYPKLCKLNRLYVHSELYQQKRPYKALRARFFNEHIDRMVFEVNTT